MLMFLIIFEVAMLVSSIGFKKYVWFISLGYGFSVMAIGGVLLGAYWNSLTIGTVLACVFLIVYGVRLGGYLAFREIKTKTYNEKMKNEIKSGTSMKFFVKCLIWISAAILYACQTSPILFRLAYHSGTDVWLIVGISIAFVGFVIEAAADIQKSKAKKKNPRRFVDKGLYRIVRCPNYFGELLIWTGIFVSGLNIYRGVFQWVCVIIGYLGIIYVMFSGARRLEERQNRSYGNDPEYQAYYKKTPIMLPLIPLYSVVKWKWLVA